MANRLTMADIHAIQRLHESEYSGREIAALLHFDRGTVAKYIAAGANGPAASAGAAEGTGCDATRRPPDGRNPPNAPTGSEGPGANAPTGFEALGRNAPSGSDGDCSPVASSAHHAPSGPASACEEHRELIERKLDQGLSALRIHQDLVEDEEFRGSYYSVRRFVARLHGRCSLDLLTMTCARSPGPGRQVHGEGDEEWWIPVRSGPRRR